MSETTVVAVVTILLVVLPLLWALSGWLSRRSSRALLRGLGLALIPTGLVLTGLMRLLVRAIHLVVDWFAGTVMTTTIWIGVIVIAIGLVTWFVAGFMSPVDRETGRQRRQGHAARKQARTKDASPESAPTQNTSRRTTPVTRGRTADAPKTPADAPVPTSPSSSSKPASSPNKAAPKISAAEKDEDAELEAILRKRGIE
ncbi:hypothetical protein JMX53_11825 [Cutibacterium avidum]|uniref:hypothetical protein n=1 Tax=Cutibacterium avidum TaxID=33010 RepID=UPI00192ACFBD|nr:hypothetical protein [Cutibacterium avidum]QQY14889.1 hypothetical protein JMX53_11825 [Cutibacterium avidum]